jgi:hypothetical protein
VNGHARSPESASQAGTRPEGKHWEKMARPEQQKWLIFGLF